MAAEMKADSAKEEAEAKLREAAAKTCMLGVTAIRVEMLGRLYRSPAVWILDGNVLSKPRLVGSTAFVPPPLNRIELGCLSLTGCCLVVIRGALHAQEHDI